MAERYQAVKPSGDVYGVFPQALAQRYAAPSGNSGLDALRLIALQNLSGGSTNEYTAAIQAAEASQRAGQMAMDEAAMRQEAIKQFAPMAAQNVGSAIDWEQLVPGMVDAERLNTHDVSGLNKQESESFENKASGLNSLATAGYGIPQQQRGVVLMGSGDEAPIETTDSYITEKDKLNAESDRIEANARMMEAESERIDVTNPAKYARGGKSDDAASEEAGAQAQASAQSTFDQLPMEAKIAARRKAGFKVVRQGNTVKFFDKTGSRFMAYDYRTNKRLQ